MKMRDLIALWVVAFLPTGTVLPGCASNRVNLIDRETVSIERVHSKKVYFSRVDVYKEDDKLAIGGTVKSRFYIPPDSGQVDMAVINPEGEILEKVSTSHTPSVFPKRGGGRSLGVRFDVLLAIIPPEGSKVRLAYHKASRSDSKTFDCGNNLATVNTEGTSPLK